MWVLGTQALMLIQEALYGLSHFHSLGQQLLTEQALPCCISLKATSLRKLLMKWGWRKFFKVERTVAATPISLDSQACSGRKALLS